MYGTYLGRLLLPAQLVGQAGRVNHGVLRLLLRQLRLARHLVQVMLRTHTQELGHVAHAHES